MKPAHAVFVYVTLGLSILFLAIVVSPFLTTLVLAAILVTGAYPVYEYVLQMVKGRRAIASLLVSSAISVIFGLIVFIFFLLLSQEAVSTYQNIERMVSASRINLNAVVALISEYVGIPEVDINASVAQTAQNLSARLVEQSTLFVKSMAWFLGNFLLLVFTMFFFFKDGKRIVLFIEKIIPLPRRNSREILNKFKSVSLAMLYGVFFTAIAQGLLGGIGLAIAGIGNPIFWGTVMGFFGMLPVAGTAVVWLPASLILLANGNYISGIFLFLWGGGIVALVDNLIKPFIIARQTQTYPLATFFVVLGGLIMFGIRGAILAPLVLALFVAVTDIYEREYTRDIL